MPTAFVKSTATWLDKAALPPLPAIIIFELFLTLLINLIVFLNL